MYVLGRDHSIIALDAVTGKQIWTHALEGNPTHRGTEAPDRVNCGLVWFQYGLNQCVNPLLNATGAGDKESDTEGFGGYNKTMTPEEHSPEIRIFTFLRQAGLKPKVIF